MFPFWYLKYAQIFPLVLFGAVLALLRNWETYDAEMWLKVHPGKDGDVDAQEVMEGLCSWRGCVQPGMSLSLAEHHQPASEVRKYKGDKEAAGNLNEEAANLY